MMSEHTPGMNICPECKHRPSMRNGLYFEPNKCLCRCHDVADSAPDLLQSLCDLENILSGKPYDRDEQKLLLAARAAIAKATA